MLRGDKLQRVFTFQLYIHQLFGLLKFFVNDLGKQSVKKFCAQTQMYSDQYVVAYEHKRYQHTVSCICTHIYTTNWIMVLHWEYK